ncbi:MAG: hypothetical protein O7D95_05075 [Betaproteobacteria bacterium]|nr:hypothetical protein [Betaproteobacteria bacterium]
MSTTNKEFILEFSVPLRVAVSKKKDFILNINHYRNAHHQVLAKAKGKFERIIKNMNINIEISDPIRVHYKYYPASKRKYDSMNIISIVDKFLMDSLIKCGLIKDDNYEHVLWPTFTPMPPDKDNPRMCVSIEVVPVSSSQTQP